MLVTLSALSAASSPFIPGAAELRPFAADLWLIATIVALLLTPFFKPRPNYACAAVALAGVVLALISLLAIGPAAGGHAERFRPMLVADGMSFTWKAILLLFVAGVILMWLATCAPTCTKGTARSSSPHCSARRWACR